MRRQKIPTKCEQCGITVFIHQYRLHNNDRSFRFCSRQCKDESLKVAMRGSNNPRWKDGMYHHDGGYIRLLHPEHPMANKNRYIPVHRLIMSQIEGRNLDPEEIVHHRNGIKTDNRPENLELMTKSEHMKLHSTARWQQRKQLT